MFELPNQKAGSEMSTGLISIVFSLILTVLGLALVAYYYHGLKSSAEKFQFAASDNVTWTIVQIEVVYKDFQIALARGLVNLDQGDPVDTVQIKRAFDIYYSRLDTSSFIYGGLFSSIDDGPGEILNRLNLSKNEIAQEIDTWIEPSRRDLVATLAKVDNAADEIRSFTTQALQVLVSDASEERIGHLTILNRYASLLVIVVGLLLGMLAVSLVLRRRLKHRVIETVQVAENFKRIIDSSQDGVVIADSTGTILQYNKSAQDIFGYISAEAIGVKAEELFTPVRHHQAHQNGMQNYIATGDGHVVNNGLKMITVRHKSGREFPVEVSITASKDRSKSVIFVGIMRDISSRIENEKKLEAAVDAAKLEAITKQRFLDLMSHEMRTPLQGILATFDLLDDCSASERQRTLIDLGKRSGEKVLGQVNNTLALARLNKGWPSNQFDIIDPAASLKYLVAMLDPLLLLQSNSISLSLPTNKNIRIYGNQSMFNAVFENLLANANKYTKAGHLSVNMQANEASLREIHLTVTVQDSGIGISEDQLGIIFDDFVTAGSDGFHTVEGTGLGLGLVKRATKKMGGKINVRSTPGVGSAFTFTCQFKAAQSQREKPRARSAHDSSVGQPVDKDTKLPLVLVVDDNEINSILIGGMLERLECRYDYAEDGLVAVEKCRTKSYDLILMDLRMPNLNGVEATRAIRQLQIEQGPIVCITAQATEGIIKTIQQAGMKELLTKPIRLEALAELLKRVVFTKAKASCALLPLSSRRLGSVGTIDSTAIQDLLNDLGHDHVSGILQRFESTVKAELIEISKLLEMEQLDKAAEVLHGAAGSAGMLGARVLGEALLALETAARQGSLNAEDPRLSRCDDLLADFVLAAKRVKHETNN